MTSGGGIAGHVTEQTPRVLVLGVIEYRYDRPALDDTTRLHHDDMLSDASHQGEVVRDEQQRQ